MNSTIELPVRDKVREAARRFFTVGVGLATMLLCSCASVTYDMRKLQQPVVLNENPCLAPATLHMSDVDTYIAKVSYSDMTASVGNTTVSKIDRNNDAQTSAFRKISGQHRVIRNISLEARHQAINALFAIGDEISVKATGDVAEFQQK